MIVRIYDGKSTPAQLLTNGIGALEAISCLVYEDLNGAYRCEVTIPTGSAWSNYFFFGAIVKVMTPRGEDYFRLEIPTITLDTMSAVGWQISYDLGMPKIVNVGITAKTGMQALGIILAASPDETRFSGTSDITTVQNMHVQLQSPLAALIDQSVSNCFVRRWGGEIWRNKFIVNINTRIGSDNGYRVALGKNLLGVTETPDGSGYANRIIPKGLSANDTPLYLPEVYIDSAVANPYDNLKHTKFIDTGIKVGATDPVTGAVMYADEAAAYTAMRNMVALLYAAGADIPGVTATVSFVHLGDTDEYKAFSALAKVELGDDVTCEYLGRSLKKRVVSYVFDGLSEKYISITLGSIAKTIAQEIFAQDISLSQLADGLSQTVKQTDAYYGVELNHTDGVKVTGSTSLNGGYTKFNADQMGFFDASDNMVGGMAYIYSRLAMIASMLTDDATDPAFWAEVGEVTIDGETHRGIFGYLASYSLTEPFFKLVATHQTSPENSVFRVMLRDKLELFLKYNPTGMQIITLGGKYAGTDYMPTIGMVTNSDGSIRSVDITVGTFKGGVDSAGGLYRKDGGGAKSYVT